MAIDPADQRLKNLGPRNERAKGTEQVQRRIALLGGVRYRRRLILFQRSGLGARLYSIHLASCCAGLCPNSRNFRSQDGPAETMAAVATSSDPWSACVPETGKSAGSMTIVNGPGFGG